MKRMLAQIWLALSKATDKQVSAATAILNGHVCAGCEHASIKHRHVWCARAGRVNPDLIQQCEMYQPRTLRDD